MRSLGPGDGDVRACDVDGLGHEAALAHALQALRSRSQGDLRNLTGDGGLAALAAGNGALGRSQVADDRLDACLEGLDYALSFAISDSNLEVFSEGELAPKDLVLETSEREHSARQVDAGRLAAALAGGYTIRLNGVDRLVPAVGELCRLVELAAATSANTNAYLTGAQVPGARAHFDSHDVAIVQLVGSKGWVCGTPPVVPSPGTSGDMALPAPEWKGKLGPRGVLTIPRGTVHEPHPDGSMSIHLSFGVRRPGVSEILGRAVGSDPALSADGGQALLDDASGESGPALVDALRGVLSASAVGRVLGRYRYRQPVRRTISVATHQHALQQPELYELRWCAPGGVVLPRGDRDGGIVGVASQLLALDDGDFDPFLRLLGGESVGPDAWASETLGIESFRCLASTGICEPTPRAR